MINPQWLELPMSRKNFHGPKDVRAIEVQLYFIAHIAKNAFVLHWKKKVKTGISDYPSLAVIEIATCFFEPTAIFSDAEMKVVGNSIVQFSKICL